MGDAMTEKQKIIAAISIPPTAPIRQAMAAITKAPRHHASAPAGLVLITDRQRHLLGIATDGDIRRAIERGSALSSPITAAMNARPFLITGLKPNAEVLALVLEKIKRERWRRDKIRNIIVVDDARRVIDTISFFDLWRNSEVRFKHIGVVGLGYVGLTLALTLADHGFQVRGMDVNPRVARSLRRGRPHFYEVGLAELLRDHHGRNFEVVGDFAPHHLCDMYFIAVGTPVGRDGQPSFRAIGQASRTVGRALKQGDAVILRSTMPVGTTREVVIPILERMSGLTAGRDFYIAFAPERTVEGRALEELKHLPQVIGGIDRVSAEVAAHLFNAITSYSVIMGSLEEAEMVKLVNNTYRDVTFAFSNELAMVCQRWGIDTQRVIEAANRDYGRSDVPPPSPGVGGYCLKKDPFIFISSARAKGYSPRLAAHARAVSEGILDFMAERIMTFLRGQGLPKRRTAVLIIGVAFKGQPVTSDLRGSTALDLAKRLRPRVGRIVGYDPAVAAREIHASGLQPVSNIRAAVRGSDAVVVMNSNPAFRALNMRTLLAARRRPTLLVDPWGLYSPEEISKVKGITYFRL